MCNYLSDLWLTSAGVIPKLCGVYRIVCLTDGRVYIGSAAGVEGFSGRIRKHINALKAGQHHATGLQEAVGKHGPENFIFEILQATSPEQAIPVEQRFLDAFQPFGQSGFNTSTRSDAIKGKLSLASRQKIRESKIGTKLSEETKRKIGRANAGRVKSLETRKKISDAGKGRPYPKNAYPALLEKIAKHYELEKDGVIYRGRNVKEFAKLHGLPVMSLGNVVRGEQVSCGGFHLPGVKLPVGKVYYAKSPSGKVRQIANLGQFCKNQDLSHSALWSVLNSHKPFHKSSEGWTRSSLEEYAAQKGLNPPFEFKTVAGARGYAYNVLKE